MYRLKSKAHDESNFVSVQKSKQLIAASIPISGILQSGLFDKLVKMKYDIPNNKLELFDNYIAEIDKTLAGIMAA